MTFQLHSVLKPFSTLFALEWGFICVLAKVLVVVPFITITVLTLTTLVHYPAVGSFMLH